MGAGWRPGSNHRFVLKRIPCSKIVDVFLGFKVNKNMCFMKIQENVDVFTSV